MKARRRLAEWSNTPEGKAHYEKVANEMREQVKKDLPLTIDDIEMIHTFLYAVKNNKTGMFTFTRLSDEQYEEVLRRFQKAKEEKE